MGRVHCNYRGISGQVRYNYRAFGRTYPGEDSWRVEDMYRVGAQGTKVHFRRRSVGLGRNVVLATPNHTAKTSRC